MTLRYRIDFRELYSGSPSGSKGYQLRNHVPARDRPLFRDVILATKWAGSLYCRKPGLSIHFHSTCVEVPSGQLRKLGLLCSSDALRIQSIPVAIYILCQTSTTVNLGCFNVSPTPSISRPPPSSLYTMGASSDYEKDATAAYVTDASLRSNPDQDPEYDAVFGKYEEGQVNYKSVGW